MTSHKVNASNTASHVDLCSEENKDIYHPCGGCTEERINMNEVAEVVCGTEEITSFVFRKCHDCEKWFGPVCASKFFIVEGMSEYSYLACKDCASATYADAVATSTKATGQNN